MYKNKHPWWFFERNSLEPKTQGSQEWNLKPPCRGPTSWVGVRYWTTYCQYQKLCIRTPRSKTAAWFSTLQFLATRIFTKLKSFCDRVLPGEHWSARLTAATQEFPARRPALSKEAWRWALFHESQSVKRSYQQNSGWVRFPGFSSLLPAWLSICAMLPLETSISWCRASEATFLAIYRPIGAEESLSGSWSGAMNEKPLLSFQLPRRKEVSGLREDLFFLSPCLLRILERAPIRRSLCGMKERIERINEWMRASSYDSWFLILFCFCSI